MSKSVKSGVYLGLSLSLLFIGALGVINTHVHQTAGQPAVIMEVMDPSLQQFAAGWQKEIGRRFPNSVGILCHGGNFVDDQWITSTQSFAHLTTAQEVIAVIQHKYPGRVVVLLACNPGHLAPHLPGVYYATDSVWCIPDRDVMSNPENAMAKLDPDDEPAPKAEAPANRSDSDPGVVGNIFEFVTR